MATSSTPSLDPPAATPSIGNAGPFMRAPREIRDNIYRFLLSTKHTKEFHGEPASASSAQSPNNPTEPGLIRYFHTSILFTNRQVYIEASNIFYMENLFIRINSVAANELYHPTNFGGYRSTGSSGRGLRVLSTGTKAQACTRHVMEINLIPSPLLFDHHGYHHFIFACDDLPVFCRALRSIDRFYRRELQPLQVMDLWFTIGDEVGTAGKGYLDSNASTDGNPVGYLTAATKIAAANCAGPDENRRATDESSASVYGEIKGSGSAMVNGIKDAKSRLLERPISIDSPRSRRLLEPFRAVYNVGYSYIDAPISERYRQEIHTSLSRARPSIHDQFLAVSSAFEEAIAVYDADDIALAIQKSKGTLDILSDFRYLSRDGDSTKSVPTGRYTGLMYREAMDKMHLIIYSNLARANLRFHSDLQQVRSAQDFVWQIRGIRARDAMWPEHPGSRRTMRISIPEARARATCVRLD
ncbi:hypothetical protein HO133_007056 [Letharia lupina]|uniref:Uncharacterized protein n=1 Tax=Letharia lupina TaxID=560253 RepID=A0A8H6KY29_9LECA|nr:uncharacterized protein HO133_007056 [Letharia lupina]KAF6228944.1 hypothetical protein HO133_007056 [Letharia lupina]